ncbi:high-potential iron-sulfur protein [Rhodothermus sp. AH-315-K08]|nr:high-potential iron-sulfur protein [Rhodothermus sp. AH-315-K08]
MESMTHNRRLFLKRFSAAVAIGAGTSTLLSACGGGESAETAAPAPAPEPAPMAETGCNDTAGLTEQEVAMRNQLQYVDETPDAEKTCANCALYLAAEEGSSCGGCNLLKGPIAPAGYCISWAAAQT